MHERLYKEIISKKNLELAWKRITARTAYSYKGFFRDVYYAYQMSYKENIRLLHERLKGGWRTSESIYVYLPKPSGLLRTITLLPIEDQIVFQAVANVFVRKIYSRRKPLQYKYVFSNILNSPKIQDFIVRDWRSSYSSFQNKSIEYFEKRERWIIDFDLAAYYDTISHKLLTKVVSPGNGQRQTWTVVKDWLEKWSSTDQKLLYQHGIPQGPLASNLLAESFLLDLDEKMAKLNCSYLRYVDDIRLFNSNKTDALKAVVELDKYCKSKGLIPQSGKLAIKKVDSIDDLIKFQPSLSYNDSTSLEEPSAQGVDKSDAEKMIKSSLSGRPYEIVDRTKFKYAIFRAPKSSRILNWLSLLLSRHPEFIDAFCQYFLKYGTNKKVENAIKEILFDSNYPFDYVKGELWKVMSGIGTSTTRLRIYDKAREVAEDNASSAILRAGTCLFMLRCGMHHSGLMDLVLKQNPIIQSMLVPYLPNDEYDNKRGVIRKMLKSKNFEVGITLANELIKRKKTHTDFDINASSLPMKTQNVFRSVGLIRTRFKIDQIGEILNARYKVPVSNCWRNIFVSEYHYALRLLNFGDRLYDIAPSTWLQQQDSFNDILTRCLATYFTSKGMTSDQTSNNGRLINYGYIIKRNSILRITYPRIFDNFDIAHKRRNKLPPSHPYDLRSGNKSYYLTYGKEKADIRKALAKAYNEIIKLT